MFPFALALLSMALGASAADLEAIIPSGYEKVWWDRGGLAHDDFICWAALPTDATSYKSLGHRGQKDHDDIHEPIMAFKDLTGEALARGTGVTMIWDDRRSVNWNDGSVWRMQCPAGYVAVGDFFYGANRIATPGQDFFHKSACVLETLTGSCSLSTDGKIWDDSGSLASQDVSVWQPAVDDTMLGGFLFANNVHEEPPKMDSRCLLKSSYTIKYV